MPLIFTCQARDLARGIISQQLSVSASCVKDYTPFLLGHLDLFHFFLNLYILSLAYALQYSIEALYYWLCPVWLYSDGVGSNAAQFFFFFLCPLS